ncbi:MAG: PorV/PorQ family protein [Bacteroidota bacterium]
MKRIVLATLIVLLIASQFAPAGNPVSKRGTTAAPFLEFGVGPRAVGMGEAFTAVANDASAMYWNPAGMERLSMGEVAFSYMNWVADMDFMYAGVVFKAGSTGSFGISLTSLSTPEMLVRTVDQPEGLGSRFDAADLALGVSYAKYLTDRFSFGSTFKYIQRRIWHMEASAVALDFGVLYSLPVNGMKLGISISNMGSKLQMRGSDLTVSTDTDPLKEGNTTAVMTELRTKEWSLPLLFRFGIAYDLVESESHTLTIASDYLHPNDNTESVNVGLEYTFENLLTLRGGYQSLFMDESEKGLTLGVGLKQGGVGVDYSYSALQNLGYVQQFSAKIQF